MLSNENQLSNGGNNMNQSNSQASTIKDYLNLLNQKSKVVQLIEMYEVAGLKSFVRKYETLKNEIDADLMHVKKAMLAVREVTS
jgi:hypothetical protein